MKNVQILILSLFIASCATKPLTLEKVEESSIVHEELDDLAVIKVQAEVPLQERRGETGPISGIVFRGSRGANSPIRIPNNVSAGVKKRLQFARNTMIKKGMGTEDIQDQLEREAEHLMKQYNEGRKYIHYSGDMESIFDND